MKVINFENVTKKYRVPEKPKPGFFNSLKAFIQQMHIEKLNPIYYDNQKLHQ